MIRTATMCIMILTAIASQAMAQEGGPPEQRPFERIERLKKVRLIEMLDLKEDQSVRFFARLNDHDQAKRDLRKERMESLDKIERLVWNHAENAEFEKVFGEIDAIDLKIAEENRNFFKGLSDILTNEQRGKFLLFERRFEKELREAMREVQQRRHRMGE